MGSSAGMLTAMLLYLTTSANSQQCNSTKHHPAATCLPAWEPTWDMRRSTFLYACNTSGMFNTTHAARFGIVSFDWSDGKQLWANANPMNSERLLTKSAETVMAADPGIPGQAPRVWVYRNTIKALNWYSSVREKLDDPKYAGWFIKYKGFASSPYPGGTSKATQDLNASFATGQPGAVHVPPCDWYNNGTAPRCSGFYHDQSQTPNHGGGGHAYPADGVCTGQCDCGPTNPCGEYIFDHRGGAVDGQTFRDWFVNEYMISNETLLHRDQVSGKPMPIGLGWLDDSMTTRGPTEENPNYTADTGATAGDIAGQVAAYQASMDTLKGKLLSMGGFYMQLMAGEEFRLAPRGKCMPKCNVPAPVDTCTATLRELCVGANKSATPPTWDFMQFYVVPDKGASAENFTDYTAEFLLTRGPHAVIGYSWSGCAHSGNHPQNAEQYAPRPPEWDEDFGVPSRGACAESGPGSGVFSRDYSLATVSWDCAKGHGKIVRK